MCIHSQTRILPPVCSSVRMSYVKAPSVCAGTNPSYHPSCKVQKAKRRIGGEERAEYPRKESSPIEIVVNVMVAVVVAALWVCPPLRLREWPLLPTSLYLLPLPPSTSRAAIKILMRVRLGPSQTTTTSSAAVASSSSYRGLLRLFADSTRSQAAQLSFLIFPFH